MIVPLPLFSTVSMHNLEGSCTSPTSTSEYGCSSETVRSVRPLKIRQRSLARALTSSSSAPSLLPSMGSVTANWLSCWVNSTPLIAILPFNTADTFNTATSLGRLRTRTRISTDRTESEPHCTSATASQQSANNRKRSLAIQFSVLKLSESFPG